MKNLISPIQYCLIAFLAINLVVSCTVDQDPPENKKIVTLKSRALGQEAYPEIYHYKTIASFANGNPIGALPKNLEQKKVSLAVTYDSDTPWAEIFKTGKIDQTGSYKFNQILTANQLTIHNQFQIDGYNECLILEFNVKSEDIAQVCQDISSIDHVVVVNIKEWPISHATSNTAASH